MLSPQGEPAPRGPFCLLYWCHLWHTSIVRLWWPLPAALSQPWALWGPCFLRVSGALSKRYPVTFPAWHPGHTCCCTLPYPTFCPACFYFCVPRSSSLNEFTNDWKLILIAHPLLNSNKWYPLDMITLKILCLVAYAFNPQHGERVKYGRSLRIGGQPCSKFHASQGYRVRPYLKKLL